MWPSDFDRVLTSEEWVTQPIARLARKYDSVEAHGWYANLEPTVEEAVELLEEGHRLLDYSAGTGIFADRLLRSLGPQSLGALLVDASPKFLRVALEKLGHDPRVAFRWIRYLKEGKRLERLDEVLPDPILERGFDLLTSTNAIHLYYGMEETLASWFHALRPGGRVLVQSGNIDNPEAHAESWIIDQTVERLQPHAEKRVRDDPRFAFFSNDLDDPGRREAYRQLRAKYFLPVRPLGYYLDQLTKAGLVVERTRARAIEARVDEWYDFLAAYHEGVLGWAGGAEKLEGRPTPNATIARRQELLQAALKDLFDGAPDFQANWTYITCRRP